VAEIEDVENSVFAARPPTVAELLDRVCHEGYDRVPELRLAVVVFAQEYRAAAHNYPLDPRRHGLLACGRGPCGDGAGII
jgi:hypothetical protein